MQSSLIQEVERDRRKANIHSFAWADPFAINFEDKHYDEFDDASLVATAGRCMVLDCESYTNYFLAAFKETGSKKVIYFEDDNEGKLIDVVKLNWVLHHYTQVGFNSRNYDLVLLAMALKGYRAADLKQVSNDLIYNQRHFTYKSEYECEQFNVKVEIPRIDHIDLIEVAPLMGSLKIYAGRLHCQRMQELPLEHTKVLEPIEKKAVKLYCINDLDNTALMLEALKPAIELRYQLSNEIKEDLRSKSDAQIAESVIKAELRKLNGWLPKRPEIVAGTKFDIQIPEFVKYELPQLQHVLKIMQSAKLTVGSDGTIALPPELEDLKIEIGQCIYRIGIGGLHTSEKQIAHKADDSTFLIDKDVASYYPSIILNQHLAPKHLGKSFLKVYREIVNRRLAAKAAGNKLVAESLKITINGTFGKLGNPYSILYSGLHIQVTLSGQLCLLMLIEFIERSGIPVVSANTDGVVVKCPKNRYNYLEAAVVHWENITGFKTEETRYKAIYSRDVNNYIAVKEDNTIKVKGAYAERGSSGNSVLSKNPEHLICNDAVAALLTKGTPIEKTIRASKDIRRFVTIRNVKGGAEKSGVYLGRAVRWYYSTKIQGTINYRTNGNKVPNTDNAMPLMELPVEFPEDVDYEFYIRKANEILDEIGYNGSPLKFSFF